MRPMSALDAQQKPARGRPALYTTDVARRDRLREWLLGGYEHLVRLRRPTFTVEGRRYPYFLHAYNRTIRNERCVEVPLVLAQVAEFTGRRILEVGNVLAHYVEVHHAVVDKYESSPGVLNVDIVDYRPAELFDLIVSISTLEHVGWDEDPADPPKLRATLDNLVGNCLRPGGRLVVTLPLGYNQYLDDALAAGEIRFTTSYWLRRLSRWVNWQQCDFNAVRGARYDAPHPFANALLVGIVEKPA
jgi:hypothetical protein